MSFFKNFVIGFVLTVVVFGCGESLVSPPTNGDQTSSDIIFELAINQVKPGQVEAFESAREAFMVEMNKEEGVGPQGTFQSFFSIPGKPEPPIYVRISEWDSIEAFEPANKNLMSGPVFNEYAETFDRLAYLQMKPEDGKEFDLGEIIKEGGAFEFAVRTVKPEFVEVFPERRAAFFDRVEDQTGYLLNREFLALKGEGEGEEQKRVLIVAWDSPEDFQNGFKNLSEGPEMMDFLSTLDVQTYQATQKLE